jgi:hypothetical protein
MTTSPGSTAAQRDAIIAKIQKLRAMTIQNGASENEASVAAAAIARLMAEWDISQSEADVRREASRCGQDYFCILRESPHEWRQVEIGIKRLFHLKVWASQFSEDILGLGWPQYFTKISFFGLPADVEAGRSLAEICHTAIANESLAESNRMGRAKGKAQYLASFRYGMAERLKERIIELIPVVPTGTGLIVLKNQLVTEEFAKLGISLRNEGIRIQLNPTAFAAGQTAAGRVNLGQSRQVSGTKALGHG